MVALDHAMVSVTNLDKTADYLEHLGFTVQPEAIHDFGTANRNVLFPNGTYIEPLGIKDREKLEKEAVDFSFLQRLEAFRFRHKDGFVVVALSSQNVQNDYARLKKNGFQSGDIKQFSRNQNMPDGTLQTIAIDLCFAKDEKAADINVLLGQHHTSHLQDVARSTHHANGVLGINTVLSVENNPSDFQYFIETVSNNRTLRATSFGIEAELDNALWLTLTPEALNTIFGIEWRIETRGLRYAGLVLDVKSLARLKSYCAEHMISYREHNGFVVIDSSEAFQQISFLGRSLHDPANSTITVGNVIFDQTKPFSLIAGPCQMESRDHAFEIAGRLKEMCEGLDISLVYKSSFDKANRTSLKGKRGLGLDKSMQVLLI
jgi:hypothetical protein